MYCMYTCQNSHEASPASRSSFWKPKKLFSPSPTSLAWRENRILSEKGHHCHANATACLLPPLALVTRWPCHAVALSRGGLFTQRHFHAVALSRGGLITQRHFHAVALSHGGLFTWRPCHEVALSRSGLIKQWPSHAMALSHGQILIVNIFHRHTGYVQYYCTVKITYLHGLRSGLRFLSKFWA